MQSVAAMRLVRRRILRSIAACLWLCLPFSVVVHAGPARIGYFERLDDLRIEDLRSDDLRGENQTIVRQSRQGTDAPGATLAIDAFGRHLDLLLERNTRLAGKLPLQVRGRIADVELYRGTISGLPGSWARLSLWRGMISGMVWDGTDLYAIEQMARVRSRVIDQDAVPGNATIIFRWRDTIGAGGAPVANPLAAALDISQKTVLLNPSSKAALSPGRQIDIGIVADAQFAAGGGAATLMLQTMNIVDGIIGAQLGLHLNVAELIEGPQPDPFTSTDPSTLLAALANYKSNSPALRNLALVHLFTGQQLAGSTGENLSVIGVANQGTLCDPMLAVSLHEVNVYGVFPELVVAHEIGHVLGAPHDGEAGSVCASTPTNFLMSPVTNGSDQFSQCSIQEMTALVSTATCVGDVPANDLSMQPFYISDPLLAGGPIDGSVLIDNPGPNDAFGLEATGVASGVELSEVGGLGTCTFSTNTFTCTGYRLSPGNSVNLYFKAAGPQPGPATVDISLTSWNDPNPANDSYRFDLDLLPAVDFATVDITASPTGVHPGEISDITWDFENTGPSTATNVQIDITTAYFDLLSVTPPPGGVCSPGPVATRNWTCTIASLPTNQTERLSLSAQAWTSSLPPLPAEHGIQIQVTAAEPLLSTNVLVYPPVAIATGVYDLAIDMAAPASAEESTPAEIVLTGRNDGPDAAQNAWLFLRDEGSLDITSATSDVGTCVIGGSDPVYCTIPTLAAGASVTVTIQGQARGVPDTSYLLSAAFWSNDFDPAEPNNVAYSTFTVTAAPSPPPTTSPPPSPPAPPASSSGGGGGGGATDPLWSLALTALSWLARRRQHARFWSKNDLARLSSRA